jgi:protein TonB
VEVPEVIEKVEDEEKIEEPTFQDTETDEEEAIEEEDIETEEPEEDVQVAFQFVESPPVYPGCEKYVNDRKKLKDCISKKIDRFISRKFNTSIAEELGLSGRIRINVYFVVDKDGRVTNVRARSTKSKLLEKEAVRVVKQMPRWKPGEQRGRKVKVIYSLPIIFQVE